LNDDRTTSSPPGATAERGAKQSGDANNRFETFECLGRGAAGAVFRARDRVRRQDVALKFLSETRPEVLYRFKQEFRSMVGLVHPHLVTLYGLHQVGSAWALSMDLVRGARSFLDYVRPYNHLLAPTDPSSVTTTMSLSPEFLASPGNSASPAAPTLVPLDFEDSLAHPTAAGTGAPAIADPKRVAIANATLDDARLVSALRDVVEGVAALHARGIVHRDLKPSNVLVDDGGRAVVCDFGLAIRGADERSRFAGTPAYASPEQAEGQPTSPASDWYSVGVMLYEALTGHLPVTRLSATETLRAKSTAAVAPPDTRAPDADPVLAALAMDLLEVDPARRPGVAAIRQRIGSSPTSQTAAVVHGNAATTFVGREDEIAQLDGAFDDARAGGTVIAVVRGPSGQGKSSLVSHVLESWTRNRRALVLSSRCYENELLAFKAVDGVIDSIAAHLLDLPDDDVEGLIDGGVNDLATLFPVLRRVPAISAKARQTRVADPTAMRGRAAECLARILAKLARGRPTVIAIDDLQWGDVDSEIFLRELADGEARPGLLLLATYRDDGPAEPELVRRLLRGTDETGRRRDLRELALEPLPGEAAEKLARSIAGASCDAAAISRDAGGSPLYVAELAYASASGELGAAQTSGLDGLLRRRIAALSGPARELLTLAALAGRPRPVALLARAARVANEAQVLTALAASRMTRTEHTLHGELVAPYHDRIRETAIARLDQRERRALHRRLARALETDRDRDLDALVEHWLGAGDTARAGHYALEAADRAMRSHAYQQAARHYETALAVGNLPADQRIALATARADALRVAGSVVEAAAAYREAAASASGGAAGELLSLALICLLRASNMEAATAVAYELSTTVGIRVPTTVRGSLWQILTRRARLALRGTRVKRIVEASKQPRNILVRLDAFDDIATALGLTDTLPGFAVHSRSLLEALNAGEPERLIRVLCVESAFTVALKGVPARKKALAMLADAEALAGNYAAPGYSHLVRGWRAFCDYLVYHECADASRRMLDAADGADEDATLSWRADVFRQYSMMGMAFCGQFNTLRLELPAMLKRARERGNEFLASSAGRQAGLYLWLAQDRAHEALSLVARSRPPDSNRPSLEHFYVEVISAEAGNYAGTATEALETIEGFWARHRKSSTSKVPGMFVWTAQAIARVALAAARQDRANRDRHLRRALYWARHIARRRRYQPDWCNGLAAGIRAQVARAHGREDEAIAHLRTATDALGRIGADTWHLPARWRLAALVGGSEAEELRAPVEAWRDREGVVNLERIVDWAWP